MSFQDALGKKLPIQKVVTETVSEDDNVDIEVVNIKLMTNEYEALINEMAVDCY